MSLSSAGILRKRLERVRPLAHVHRPRATALDDQHCGALGDGASGPGQVRFGSPADLQQDLAGAGLPAGGNDDDADGADQGLIPSHRQRLPLSTRMWVHTHYRPAGAMRVTLASAMAVPGAGIAAAVAALETIAGVFVSPGPQLALPSRTTVRLEPRCATRRGGDRTPAPRTHAPVETPAHGGVRTKFPGHPAF